MDRQLLCVWLGCKPPSGFSIFPSGAPAAYSQRFGGLARSACCIVLDGDHEGSGICLLPCLTRGYLGKPVSLGEGGVMSPSSTESTHQGSRERSRLRSRAVLRDWQWFGLHDPHPPQAGWENTGVPTFLARGHQCVPCVPLRRMVILSSHTWSRG